MNVDALKYKYPLIYQLFLGVRDKSRLRRNQREAHRIHNMSNEELETYVSNLYRDWIGHSLDWNNLCTWTEKMQWEKLYDNDPRKIICADKYAVREWVANKIGEKYLIPLLGVWKQYSNIDFESLPEQFVLKTNHGSGDVVIVRNKSKMSLSEKISMKRTIEIALRMDFGTRLCEMHYSKIKPMIIAEKVIGVEGEDLRDYKFLCFNGKPYYCCVDFDRFIKHKRNVYDLAWNLQTWNTGEYDNFQGEVTKPKNFEKMIEIASKLSEGFSHLRVDLYNLDGEIYFGEMTFTSASGLHKFTTYESDLMLGELWKLDMTKKRNYI